MPPPAPRNQIPLVVIVDTNEDDLTSIMRKLATSDRAQVVGVARRLEEINHVMTAQPDIVLLNVDDSVPQPAQVIAQIHDISPRCQVILTAMENADVDLASAMRGGARGLLRKPLAATATADAIQEVFQTEMRRLQRIEDQAKARATEGRAGEVIAVFSPKGGVGCTVISTHLAMALAALPDMKVSLVDFDLQFGDVAVHLNLHSSHGVHELMRSVDDLDAAILDDVMVKHSSGVSVLLPPPNLSQVEDVDAEGMAAITRALRRFNDYVVIDMWHAIEDATTLIMELATVLLVVTTPEVPTLRSTRRFLDYIRERQDLRSKVRLVVNRFPSKHAVELKEVERSLGVKPDTTLPSDGRLVLAAVNEGVPFLSSRSQASANMQALAASIAQPRLARRQRANLDGKGPQPAPNRAGTRP